LCGREGNETKKKKGKESWDSRSLRLHGRGEIAGAGISAILDWLNSWWEGSKGDREGKGEEHLLVPL
jgi:hypothetical protein